jgi:tetratricopeptide (TPR) repeat protein
MPNKILPKDKRNRTATVSLREEELVIPTYLPAAPDKNPMFMEKRVYQGSSGKVYPLPFTDRISETKTDRKWKAIWLENEFLRVMILPEIGGRIHAIQDKTNGYDLIYNQCVIKPALVGLAGPWISGGIEFNWPQHHRPATFLPVDFEIEDHPDGSKTVWCSDHDPMCRMKGMHGVCLHPDKAFVELKVRAYNRTPFTQTFLWWANVATRVHEAYQSFFPPDVYYVADHARRSMSEYPLAKGFYYGINYGERAQKGIPPNEVPSQFIPPHCLSSRNTSEENGMPHYAPNDLSFYTNIPTPCSYMCMGSKEDFFGGYDYKAQAGIIHVANHHISPGKKQWTWGNHNFGYAWDRNLTDADATGEFAPYIEIMAGVYTDNQPDFSFLQPGETKSWSQFWYPIQKIGPAQQANVRGVVSLKVENGKIFFGIGVTQTFYSVKIEITAGKSGIFSITRDLLPGTPFVNEIKLPKKVRETELEIRVTDNADDEIISYQIKPRAKGDVPPPATEPLSPEKIDSADELFITGLHLEQYRHATRCPTFYWREALRRDPLDSRCNNAMGRWHLRRGEFSGAERYFRNAIRRLTRRNANPYDGEPYYNLGLCLRFQLDSREGPSPGPGNQLFEDACAAFYKATWNQAWAAAGFLALAEMDCRGGNWGRALEHLNRSLRFDADNLRARDLKVIVLRKLSRESEAEKLLSETLALDPLDWSARHLDGQTLRCDLQARLDMAHDFARAGLYSEAIELLKGASRESRDLPDQNWGAMPLVLYTLGWLYEKNSDKNAALICYKRAAAESPDYCFPFRIEEILVFESAMRANMSDARAPYYLGNLFYDRRRHEEAIRLWEKSSKLDNRFSIVWRNLGIGYFNISKKVGMARAAYDKAFKANPDDARLLFERDQLWKRLGEKPSKRLNELEKFPQLTAQRDDLSVELCVLYNQTGQHDKALAILSRRKFQPWEGGEGQALGQHVRTHLALGRKALAQNDAAQARALFEKALASPQNLSEARHVLANQSDVRYWLGVALDRLGDKKAACDHWLAAATFKGDFQEMSTRIFSEMTCYSALALQRMGRVAQAKKLFRDLLAYAKALGKSKASIDYFATSLPTMLLFEDDLQFRQQTTALFLKAQACLGLGQQSVAKNLLHQVLQRDPNHALAADLAKGTSIISA